MLSSRKNQKLTHWWESTDVARISDHPLHALPLEGEESNGRDRCDEDQAAQSKLTTEIRK